MSTEEVTMPESAGDGEQRILAGRYAVGEFVGQGGMATVYRGTDTKLGRQVAIKIMKANLAGDDQFRERFRQEAQSAARMAHPTIVRVFDAGDDLIQTADGAQRLPFIVMEYIEGTNLRQLASEGKLSQTEACRIVDSVLTALEYSHRAGIVHRDIKPANIMITSSGQVKVMDFGIARAVSETSSTLQQTTAILGTAAYFSPEQAKGETVDARTDLYSTGVLLYELLTGDVPFRGDTAVAVAYQHVSERPQVPSEREPEVTAELDRVVLHSLAKDRARRFQSASEFREALRLAASGTMPKLATQAQQDTVLFSGGEEVSESDLALRQLAEGGGGPRTQSRPPVLWTWAAILTVGAVIVAVVFWLVTLAPQQFAPQNSRAVPDLVGTDGEAALTALRDLDLIALPVEQVDEQVPAGDVISTDPEAGTRVGVDETIRVYISTGPESAEVPDIDRMSLEEYTNAVEDLGLVVGLVEQQDDPVEVEGRVLAVSPEPGTRLESGESVSLTVASGKVLIPEVQTQSLDAAKSLLSGLGLDLKVTPRNTCPQEPNFPIIEQTLVGQQPQGSALEITYCSG
ncbi:Stk1 family PASTA domain-containing Ser/Thr kinase [Leucobacter sp. CSA1]|uniref:non-specific serine/threonine protein kinase n=1 Tax=Leucobacter chromiisoli TaxID=2796471 RepID=A0A934UVW2_9MICO|nr:Stk1 family PASTA domain-containing Ser/Thr kinase [Leucobacter chromiisoli]MBK0420335.1 Stk1 family PASTA domain-containing Ser/Thr kinase [Leucobacter chromiisoli]